MQRILPKSTLLAIEKCKTAVDQLSHNKIKTWIKYVKVHIPGRLLCSASAEKHDSHHVNDKTTGIMLTF